MRFGIHFISTFWSRELSTADYFAQTLRICERAEELGYTSVKTVEHYLQDYGGQTPNPCILLASIAARTRRMRLVTGAVIPAFNNPIKLAAELTMLDNISRGRLDVGFGRAYIPKEFKAFHVPMDESRARFEEGIEVIKRLWTEDRVTFDGQFHHLHDIHLMPRPLQQPHPPIGVASVSWEERAIWVGHNGYYLMLIALAGGLDHLSRLITAYRQAWREAGHTPGTEQVQIVFPCYVAESHDEAIEAFKQSMPIYIDVHREAMSSWAGVSSSSYPGYDKLLGSLAYLNWQYVLEARMALVGTPDEVVTQVLSLQRLLGDIELSLQVTFGRISEAEAIRTLELFSYHVMPLFSSQEVVL
jgi:alkanesulfonate monooxygenase SsuD/methylene tetrahydromethanopterin reductase-like flavin-dependent oxidoreductase (luciferase family)